MPWSFNITKLKRTEHNNAAQKWTTVYPEILVIQLYILTIVFVVSKATVKFYFLGITNFITDIINIVAVTLLVTYSIS